MISILFWPLTSGCSQSKSAEQVFPQTKPICLESAQKDQFLVKWTNGTITIEKGKNKKEFIKNFVKPHLKQIEHVEYDQWIHYQPALQKGMAPQDKDGGWGLERIQAPSAWQRGILGQNVTIAVIDTGVDITHSQLSQRLDINPGESGFDDMGFNKSTNGIDDDENGFVDDLYGYDFINEDGYIDDRDSHGTHVAGIIAAEHSDTSVVHTYPQGVAPKAKILPLKFISSEGGSLGDAIRAIDYAILRGAKIINASWGGASCSQLLGQKIKELESHGILFVTAAGNQSLNIDDDPEYPASYNLNNQLTIGSTGILDNMASHSNFGDLSVHLFAPGFSILSTVPDEWTGPNYGQARYTGTSMATPFVAGTAALLWSYRPQASLQQIKQAIFRSVDVDESYRNLSQGRLNISNAISYLDSLLDEQ